MRLDDLCYEMWNSVVAVQRWWRKVKEKNATIRQETIKNCHSKLLTTGSVTDARRSGRPSTSHSEENMTLVQDMFTRSPCKSTPQAARESGLSRHMVRTVLKKRLEYSPAETPLRAGADKLAGTTDDEDLTNGLQVVQMSRPVTFSCGARRRRRCTGQNLAQWNNRRTGFGTLSPTSQATFCRRLRIPSPVV